MKRHHLVKNNKSATTIRRATSQYQMVNDTTTKKHTGRGTETNVCCLAVLPKAMQAQLQVEVT
jgi:hypothetical protein